MPSKLRQVLPHGVMLLAAVLLYRMAAAIDVETGGRISPAVWPKAIIVIMGLLCAYEIAKRLLVSSDFSALGVVSIDPLGVTGAEEKPPPENLPMLLGGIALIAAYVVAVPWSGFFLTTALFLAIFPWVGGMRRPLLCGAIGLVGSLVLVVMFMRIAYISLPLGAGPFRELSIALLRVIGVT
jgi:putative tricarboxylic transport membrane protein